MVNKTNGRRRKMFLICYMEPDNFVFLILVCIKSKIEDVGGHKAIPHKSILSISQWHGFKFFSCLSAKIGVMFA